MGDSLKAVPVTTISSNSTTLAISSSSTVVASPATTKTGVVTVS